MPQLSGVHELALGTWMVQHGPELSLLDLSILFNTVKIVILREGT